MQTCDICLGEFEEDKLEKDEEGYFCTSCGVAEGLIDIDVRSIDEAISEAWGITGEGREPINLEFYNNQLDYIVISRFHAIKNSFKTTEWTEVLNQELNGRDSIQNIADKYNYQTTKINTYNGESTLDGVLLMTILHKKEDYIRDEDALVAIEWHYHGDVRANYSKPLIVKPKDLEFFLMGITQISASDQSGNHWISENGGYSWRYQGNNNLEDTDLLDNLVIDKDNEKVYFKGTGAEITFQNTALHS